MQYMQYMTIFMDIRSGSRQDLLMRYQTQYSVVQYPVRSPTYTAPHIQDNKQYKLKLFPIYQMSVYLN